MTNSINPLIQISIPKYEKFCQQLQNNIDISNLDVFKIKSTCDLIAKISNNIFCDEIMEIKKLLNDINIGIAGLDVPEIASINKSINAVCGVATVIGIFNNIGKSIFDPINSTPFTLHTASHSGGKLLESTEHTPEAKLGFHNDGLLNSENLEIPINIVLYNLYIGYCKPGNLKWIPVSLWDQEAKFGSDTRSENIRIKIKLTPHYNLNKEGGITKNEFDLIEIPISSINEYGQRKFFLNGKILNDNNSQKGIDFVQNIRKSLECNSTIINIQQKERRAFYLNNAIGFHARDVFEDPIAGVDLTRVFLRSVDENAEIYPSSRIKFAEVIN